MGPPPPPPLTKIPLCFSGKKNPKKAKNGVFVLNKVNIARIANAVQVTICLLVSTNVY